MTDIRLKHYATPLEKGKLMKESVKRRTKTTGWNNVFQNHYSFGAKSRALYPSHL